MRDREADPQTVKVAFFGRRLQSATRERKDSARDALIPNLQPHLTTGTGNAMPFFMSATGIPSLLVTCDDRELFAYLVHPDGIAETAEHIDYQEDCQTCAPLVDWTTKKEGYRMLAGILTKILDRYRTSTWGLAASADLLGGLEEYLPAGHLEALVSKRCFDVSGLSVSNVTSAFDGSGKSPCAEVLRRSGGTDH